MGTCTSTRHCPQPPGGSDLRLMHTVELERNPVTFLSLKSMSDVELASKRSINKPFSQVLTLQHESALVEA